MLEALPPRERQILDLLYCKEEATVSEIRADLPVRLSDQAVRTMLTRLEGKGVVRRGGSDRGIIYSPAVPQAAAKESALLQLVKVFFNGSTLGAANALLGMSDKATDEELHQLERTLERARRERRK